MARSVEYGLTAAIGTERLKMALTSRPARSVGVTSGSTASRPTIPDSSFSGMKNSGVGREEGLQELLSYTESKALHVHL